MATPACLVSKDNSAMNRLGSLASLPLPAEKRRYYFKIVVFRIILFDTLLRKKPVLHQLDILEQISTYIQFQTLERRSIK